MSRDGVVLVLCAVLILFASSFEEPRRENPPAFNCECKPEILGRQFVASFCDAPTNQGPWNVQCFYKE